MARERHSKFAFRNAVAPCYTSRSYFIFIESEKISALQPPTLLLQHEFHSPFSASFFYFFKSLPSQPIPVSPPSSPYPFTLCVAQTNIPFHSISQMTSWLPGQNPRPVFTSNLFSYSKTSSPKERNLPNSINRGGQIFPTEKKFLLLFISPFSYLTSPGDR